MDKKQFPYQRISVIGSTGSGKSTLASALAQQRNLEYIELDALHWLPGWVERDPDEFRVLVEKATRGENWVIDGNYRVVRDINWKRAQAVVWLDYPLPTIFLQLWRRTWRRWWQKDLLWGNNRERIWSQFMVWSPERSIFAWLFSTYWQRKREYQREFTMPEYAHLKVIRLGSPKETRDFL